MEKEIRISARVAELKDVRKASHMRKANNSPPKNSPIDRVIFFQRTIGNQAVQKLISREALQAKLRIGRPGDVYEQEADRVADAVLRMPEPKAVTGHEGGIIYTTGVQQL